MHKVTENIFPIEWNLIDPLKVQRNEKKVFGTFVCGGGSTMGYKLAGYNHLGGVEFTDHYSRIYKRNHSPKYFYLEDIREFNKRTNLPKELFDLDLLDGSPPCAAFSTAGSREKVWGKKSAYEDKIQVKDDLVYIYCSTIKKLKPKVAILENVTGLIKGNAKMYAKNIFRTLQEIGYKPQLFKINAASIGIPQMRERVFFIALRNDFNLPKLELNFKCRQINFEATKKYWENGGASIEKYAISKQWDETEIGTNHKKRFSLSKPALNKPCPTITEASCNVSAASVVHPIYKRKLNVDEVRMVSTFPLDYDFMDVDPVSVMGRSVLPVMMANISHQINLQWLSKL